MPSKLALNPFDIVLCRIAHALYFRLQPLIVCFQNCDSGHQLQRLAYQDVPNFHGNFPWINASTRPASTAAITCISIACQLNVIAHTQ